LCLTSTDALTLFSPLLRRPAFRSSGATGCGFSATRSTAAPQSREIYEWICTQEEKHPGQNLQGHNLHPWAQPWFRPHPVIANKVGIDGGAAFEGGAILLVEWPSLSFFRIPTSDSTENLLE